MEITYVYEKYKEEMEEKITNLELELEYLIEIDLEIEITNNDFIDFISNITLIDKKHLATCFEKNLLSLEDYSNYSFYNKLNGKIDIPDDLVKKLEYIQNEYNMDIKIQKLVNKPLRTLEELIYYSESNKDIERALFNDTNLELEDIASIISDVSSKEEIETLSKKLGIVIRVGYICDFDYYECYNIIETLSEKVLEKLSSKEKCEKILGDLLKTLLEKLNEVSSISDALNEPDIVDMIDQINSKYAIPFKDDDEKSLTNSNSFSEPTSGGIGTM